MEASLDYLPISHLIVFVLPMVNVCGFYAKEGRRHPIADCGVNKLDELIIHVYMRCTFRRDWLNCASPFCQMLFVCESSMQNGVIHVCACFWGGCQGAIVFLSTLLTLKETNVNNAFERKPPTRRANTTARCTT